jgi:signal transduction histidine kinase
VMNGAEATKVIKSRHPEVKVLALTAFADMNLVSEMVKAGASGYLLKGGSSDELIQSLQAIARGEGALDREVTRGVIDDMATLYKSEHERAAALAELNRMKSEFVSIVSHELRTPLASIKGGVQTLKRGWQSIPDPEKLELLDSVGRQSDKLARLVGQILTVSGMQRGGFGLTPSVFSLSEVATEVASLFKDRAVGRLSLELQPAFASGDRDRIREVTCSLIENALGFTAGPVVVTTESNGSVVKLHVQDEGPGLDATELRGRLDEPFNQGDSSSTRTVGGLGLSLYIARHVLEASGGRLDFDTAPDRGSTFTMVLPQHE